MPDFMNFLHSEHRFSPGLHPESSAYYWNNSVIIKTMTLYRCGSWDCGADPKILKMDKTMEDGRDIWGTCKCDQIHQLTSTINKPAVIKHAQLQFYSHWREKIVSSTTHFLTFYRLAVENKLWSTTSCVSLFPPNRWYRSISYKTRKMK